MNNKTITITEQELPNQLKKFSNKDVCISFNGYVSERIILQNIKVKKRDFTIIMRSKDTEELFAIDLCDLSNSWKTLDNNTIYVFSETVGKIKITQSL